MNNKRKEGEFYAAKVRLFLNEYGGENLHEFCDAEKVSYKKMLNCLGRAGYCGRGVQDCSSDTAPVPCTGNQQAETDSGAAPMLPLVVVPDDGQSTEPTKPHTGGNPLKWQPVAAKNTAPGLFGQVSVTVSNRITVNIGKCDPKGLAELIREMEVPPC